VGDGATLAYAVLAQAPPGIFAGALSLGFRPRLSLGIPLCGIEPLLQPADPRQPQSGHGVTRYLPAKRLSAAWILVQDGRDRDFPEAAVRDYVSGIRQASVVVLPAGLQDRSTTDRRVAVFSDAYSRLATAGPKADTPAVAALNDLPLIEMAATGRAPPGLLDSYVVLLSGDGGWAGLDRSVAAVLQARGLPVVGFDSLRYFWTPRTPSGLAGDLARLLAYYEGHWHKRRVLLVGYSQGADVLPFAVGRLPPARRAGIGLVTLMGPGRSAAFEFHVSHWFGNGSQGLPILPEMQRLAGLRVQCLYGDDEASESLCPLLDPQGFDVRRLAGGHHFGGDYGAIAGQILEAARAS
jgi:type IV secretory pathway VirJ component